MEYGRTDGQTNIIVRRVLGGYSC